MEQARTDLMHRLKSAPAAARPGIPPTHPGSHSQSNILKHEAVNHRRSHSDVPFAFLPPRAHSDDSKSSDADDLFNAYMNLDSLDSGSKADSSENEAESSSVYETGPQGHKRTAPPMLPPRHCRSMSMDSFVGKLNFADESPRGTHLPPPIPATFEFGNGEFNAVELKKIATNEKLAEIALSDPRRVKRILANRQSAARSKERKMRYISELEHKVQTLQTEATTLSAQLTLFQRDYSGLNSQNNELKFRLQAMEQQAKLRDALNDALNGEVQRLKLAAAELGETELSNNLNQQIQLNPPTFELQHLQRQQFQFQQQQQQSNSVSDTETKN